MQTHCPHCDTRFRVTEVQINIADGFVRCGVCNEVFNAFEVASQNERQHSLLDEKISENEPDNGSSEVDDSAVIDAETQETDFNDSNNSNIETNEYLEI